jgi:hypothetical protein
MSFSWVFDSRLDVSVILVLDSVGEPFSPDSCSHAYAYNGSNQLQSDTATDPITGFVRVKTYSYTGSNLTGETAWVRTS